MTYILSVDAELDLDEIWEYIARDSLDAADRWIARLFDTFQSLAQNPGIGHRREDLTTLPLLFFPVEAYLILYRVQTKSIDIVAVTHGARDIPSFLEHRRN
jgi:plasmid stabilization system protein ParE